MAETGLNRRFMKAYGLGTALVLVLGPLGAVDRAEAACTQTGETIDCTGANGPQNSADPNIVYHVESGATVGGAAGPGIAGGTVNVDATGAVSSTAGDAIAGDILLLSVSNAGTLSGSSSGVSSRGELVLNNTGSITASGATGDGVSAHRATIGNSGAISGTRDGISGGGETVTISNSGTVRATGVGGSGIVFNPIGLSGATALAVHNTAGLITGDGFGINVAGANAALTLDNAGIISGTGAGGIGVSTVGTLNLTSNTGTITGGLFGIAASGDSALQNAGTISGGSVGVQSSANLNVVNASGGQISGAASGLGGLNVILNNSGSVSATNVGGAAVQANTLATVTNSGTIKATGNLSSGIEADNINILGNSGTISGVTNGINVTGPNGTANVNNSGGLIEATGASGSGISAINVNVTGNTGTIRATGTSGVAIDGTTVNVTNNAGGTIAGTGLGSIGIFGASSVTLTNSGTISGDGFGVISNGTATLANSGVISAKNAVAFASGATITNAGSIISTDGPTGTAIQLSSAADTLNILPGSKIVGLIDMGHGADVINVTGPTTPARGISMLSLSASGVIGLLKQQLLNFDGVINTIASIFSGNSQPAVTSGANVATLDPTALAQQDRTLMDFSGGVSSMVRGRLGSSSTEASNVQMMSYAMEEPTAPANGALGNEASREARAQMFNKAPAAGWGASPVTVWSSAFGGVRNQSGTDTTLNSTSSTFGGLIGVDRRVTPDWLIGVFAGGGAGHLGVELSSQTVDTDYVFGGGYSRFAWGPQFVDLTVQGGGVNNRSTRHVQNNITGGLESASASYNGWYVSPEVAYGYQFDIGNGYVLTPMARLRYVAGFFDGYNEAGSAQTLSIGRRTLQDLEERAELKVSKVTTVFGDHLLRTTFHGGAIALQRTGDTTVNAVLIGQGLTFITPGAPSATGVVAGASFDYHTSANVALFGAVEGMAMSDQSRTGSARAGVRVAF